MTTYCDEYRVYYHDTRKELNEINIPSTPIQVVIPSSVVTIGDLKSALEGYGLYNDNTNILTIKESRGYYTAYPNDYEMKNVRYAYRCKNELYIGKLATFNEESALKASNESEVKALKTQLMTAIEAMVKIAIVNDDLKRQLLATNTDSNKIQEILIEIKNQNKMTFDLMKSLVRD